ncbi:GNAT family N-acetyltransferase [Stappia sp. ES.058]|uniref:GNAT family N-acetyltransferase n=1 Tax=Stappia sp. ES.058 TaxID=1881061 RepID=UPI00087BD75A|nr:GNAT family N-acetyltransferase [Stappia sp. ES.058]SDU43176.1 Acetyltransferase (GNAT) family protein [Stappia sp. ES.058]
MSPIIPVEDAAAVATCFELMRQLRPHLKTVAEFVARWQSQEAEGYRLLAIYEDGRPVALAGYRLQKNLMHGRHLYLDDLVTEQTRRSGGLGQRLLDHVQTIGHAEGCSRLSLDTPLSNALGHRFYFRQGMLASALRFNIPLTSAE